MQGMHAGEPLTSCMLYGVIGSVRTQCHTNSISFSLAPNSHGSNTRQLNTHRDVENALPWFATSVRNRSRSAALSAASAAAACRFMASSTAGCMGCGPAALYPVRGRGGKGKVRGDAGVGRGLWWNVRTRQQHKSAGQAG